MKVLFLILAFGFLLALTACRALRHEPRLDGKWRSNKDETVSAWKHEGIIQAKVIDRFEKEVLGKMVVTYAGRRVTSTSDDWIENSKYRIVEAGTDYVVFDQFSGVYQRTLRWKVRFVKNGYWISNDEILKGYMEKFDRVTE